MEEKTDKDEKALTYIETEVSEDHAAEAPKDVDTSTLPVETNEEDKAPTDNEIEFSDDEAAEAPKDVKTPTVSEGETGATEDCSEERTNNDLNTLKTVEIVETEKETQ